MPIGHRQARLPPTPPPRRIGSCRSSGDNREECTMTLIGIVAGAMLLVVVVGTVVDIFRRHYSGAATVGWVALVIVLPFVGAVIYWVARKPEPVDAENLYRLEAEQRHEAARRRYASPGRGPCPNQAGGPRPRPRAPCRGALSIVSRPPTASSRSCMFRKPPL